MRIAVISDLHLGRRDRADQFGHTDSGFVRFLRFLERNFERIILLGDIYETHGTWPREQRKELSMVMEAYPLITSRINTPRYDYVYGNHDTVMGKVFPKTRDELLIETDGLRLLFRHGHRFGWFQRHLPSFPAFMVFLGMALARRGLDKLYTWGAAFEAHLSNGYTTKFEMWALGLAKARETDIIVTGHTHIPKVLELDEGMYFNSGACSHGRFSWLSLDTKEGIWKSETSW